MTTLKLVTKFFQKPKNSKYKNYLKSVVVKRDDKHNHKAWGGEGDKEFCMDTGGEEVLKKRMKESECSG